MKRPSALQKLFQRPELKELMEHLSKEDDTPSRWLDALKTARECEARFDWDGAEKAYVQSCEAESSPSSRVMGYLKLSDFYSKLGRREQAINAASKAIELGDDESVMGMVLSQALHKKALLCLAANNIEEAEQLTNRLLEIATDTERDLMHYFALLLRARIAVKKGQFENAEADLKTVWDYIEAGDEDFMLAGYQRAIGDWWNLKGKIYAANGDTVAALNAKREEVKRHRIIAQLPQIEGSGKHDNLARTLWEFGKQLEAADDAGAKYAFNESRSIRESIGLSGDFS